MFQTTFALGALTLLALATHFPGVAKADPAGSQTVWILAGKAQYTPSGAITWGMINVKEADGGMLSIGCQSGPFTPYDVDGKIELVDRKKKADGTFNSYSEYTRRYADG